MYPSPTSLAKYLCAAKGYKFGGAAKDPDATYSAIDVSVSAYLAARTH